MKLNILTEIKDFVYFVVIYKYYFWYLNNVVYIIKNFIKYNQCSIINYK